MRGHSPFTNYGEDARLGPVEAYEYQWFAFDNATGATGPMGAAARPRPHLAAAGCRPSFLRVRIRTLAPGLDGWKKAWTCSSKPAASSRSSVSIATAD